MTNLPVCAAPKAGEDRQASAAASVELDAQPGAGDGAVLAGHQILTDALGVSASAGDLADLETAEADSALSPTCQDSIISIRGLLFCSLRSGRRGELASA
jgi:hypothetical protein